MSGDKASRGATHYKPGPLKENKSVSPADGDTPEQECTLIMERPPRRRVSPCTANATTSALHSWRKDKISTMRKKNDVRKNLTELVRLAGQEGASGLISFGILVMHNGSIEAWLHGEDGDYGCWSLGESGEVVTELNMSREELMGLDIAVTTQWIEEKLSAYAMRRRAQLVPNEIYLGGELLAIRTDRYVMVAPAFNEIRTTFTEDECAFGFHRVSILDGKEDLSGIMESILQDCFTYLETHTEACICVADGKDRITGRDEDWMSFYTFADLPKLRMGSEN